ncbi:MAG: ABC transporter substrate-binding protein [Deinococcus sp.]|nr:ABC transporter substrate-binding protein [Deinococcus sp.]
MRVLVGSVLMALVVGLALGQGATRTVTDDLGRVVQVPDRPQRIVALSPTTTELLYAVGGTAVGVPSSATFPAEVQDLPKIGRSQDPNLEAILALTPDLILADAVINAAQVAELAALGVPVVFVQVLTYQEVSQALAFVGEVIGNRFGGELEALRLERTLRDIQDRLPLERPTVYVSLFAGGMAFAATPQTYIGNLVEQVGGVNIATSGPPAGRFTGFVLFSLEQLVAADPDVILFISAGPPPNATTFFSQDALFQTLSAFRNGRVFELDPVPFELAPGPRAGDAVRTLAELLYPDIF